MKEYENIVEDIKQKIINATLVAGDKLPSIKEMTKIYSVSSITVRNSLSILVNEGYIETKERSGCFVKKSENDRFTFYFNELTNIKDTIINTKTLGISQIFDFNGIDEFENIKNKNVSTIKIRRTFNSYLDAPVAYDIKYLIHHFKGDIEKFFYYDTLRRIDYFLETGLKKTLEIHVIQPTSEIIDVLKISQNVPVFYFKQKYFDEYNQLVLVGQTYTIADSINLTAATSH